GHRLKLEPKPMQVLRALLERAGRVVTRGELRQLLWGEGVFVDFEKGLSVAVTKLRAALNDPAEAPKFIETVTGEGYRFVAAVERVLAAPEAERFPRPAEEGGISSLAAPGALADPQLGLKQASTPHIPARSIPWPYWLALSAIVITLTSAIVGFRFHNETSTHLRPQDWVLVSQFDNRTGESGLGDIATYALKAELSSSRLVRIVPAERIQEVLQMMKRPPNASVDAAAGREICLRDGRIKALVVGRIQKIGQRYLMNVLIVDPVTDVAVKGFTEEAADQVGLLHSIRRLSNQVREQLGEALPLIQHDSQGLEPVTTASLHALQLYSAAARSGGDDAQVDELLSAALREDPQFASAYIGLAWASMNRDKPKELWLPQARRALELANNLPERERYFIRGSYNQMVGNPAEAIAAYESLLQLDPKNPEPLEHLYELTRRKELLYRLAEIHADSFEWNLRAWTKANAEGDAAAERRFAMRAQQLATPANLEAAPLPGEAAVKLARAYHYLQQGDLRTAQAEAERASADFPVLGPHGKESLAVAEGNFYLFLGKLQKAESWYAHADPVSRHFYSAVLAEARGVAFSSSLARIWHEDATSCLFDPEVAVKLASAGDFRLAERLAGPEEAALDSARAGLSDYSSLSKGTLELYHGNVSAAIRWLERANADLRAGPSIDLRIVGTRLLAAEILAKALEKEGNMRAAAEVLEPFETNPIFDPADVLGSPAGARLQLARLYRKLGRVAEAKRIESELRALFAESDPDYQLARLLHGLHPS
ncbi:MAG TPA: winged helix-turn-helix domain-containing protein, partial [Terriglobia bacterium]|nr:winged helix-turn-helix domain-containing protein [Terriglobia bacterium]